MLLYADKLISEQEQLYIFKTTIFQKAMQTQTTHSTSLTHAALFNEQQTSAISAAVEENRRADFAFLVAMFADDVCELALANNPALRSCSKSYDKSALIAQQFHQGGLHSARLQNNLNPDALAYMTEHTHDLGEEVYRNLSAHTQRSLSPKATEASSGAHLYNALLLNQAKSNTPSPQSRET